MKDPRLFLLKTKALLQHIIKFHIKPQFGICAGSEKQGGQHEGRDKPVQAAASYFTTLTVDGQNRDLVNIWRNNEIEGGDQLIMHLAPVKRSHTVLYTLNHYSHGTVSKYMTFGWLCGCVLQLIPTFFKVGELPARLSLSLDIVPSLLSLRLFLDSEATPNFPTVASSHLHRRDTVPPLTTISNKDLPIILHMPLHTPAYARVRPVFTYRAHTGL
jgi:hypothetical protein